MISPDLSAVGFDAPTFAELADAAVGQGIAVFEGWEACEQLLVYQDASGARLIIMVQQELITMFPSFAVETAFWPATAGMINDVTGLIQTFDQSGRAHDFFTAQIDEPFRFPFIEAPGLITECSQFYPDLRIAALATDVEVYPSVEEWQRVRAKNFEQISTADGPLTVYPTSGFLHCPHVEAYLSGVLSGDLGSATWIVLEVAQLQTRTNTLTGLQFHVITGHLEGHSTPLQMCLGAEDTPPLHVGCVIEGAAIMIANSGLWDALHKLTTLTLDQGD
ncbi:hypothetical protein [Corynebacterium nasicanis]|uniref:Uncharacterized protein n=1 Tax=Corynebacterium nasicanis TaxID=1448267 RepID=A0ABW1QCA8_9CORY